MAGKYYWIKERENPQFKKPYFVACGNITVSRAMKMERASYGSNYMHKFETKLEYDSMLAKLKREGFTVNV